MRVCFQLKAVTFLKVLRIITVSVYISSCETKDLKSNYGGNLREMSSVINYIVSDCH